MIGRLSNCDYIIETLHLRLLVAVLSGIFEALTIPSLDGGFFENLSTGFVGFFLEVASKACRMDRSDIFRDTHVGSLLEESFGIFIVDGEDIGFECTSSLMMGLSFFGGTEFDRSSEMDFVDEELIFVGLPARESTEDEVDLETK